MTAPFPQSRPLLVKRAGSDALALLPSLAALVVIVAYAALLPDGRWQGDEYLGTALIARGDWAVLFGTFTWAPRPIAASVSWLYYLVSDLLDRPLIASFLGTIWLACLAAVALAWSGSREQRPLGVALQLFALTLLLSIPGEMFYWPVGAAAYLPCWAGLAAATALHRVSWHQHGAALMVSLGAAVCGTEIGAVTVLAYAGLYVIVGLARSRSLSPIWPLIPPVLIAFVVCVITLGHRMAPMHEVMQGGYRLAGHWFGSIAASVPTFAREFISIDGVPLSIACFIKILLFLGFARSNSAAAPDIVRAPLWGMALLFGAFLSVVLAYHQFGTLCCQRHASLRQGMILLAIVDFAGLLRLPRSWMRPVILAAVLAGLLVARSKPLLNDWRALPTVIAARTRTWQSGRQSGDAMVLYVAPAGLITGGNTIPAGNYERRGDAMWGGAPWYAWGVMARFGKHSVAIKPFYN